MQQRTHHEISNIHKIEIKPQVPSISTMNNQGLEALAALASVAPSPVEAPSAADKTQNREHDGRGHSTSANDAGAAKTATGSTSDLNASMPSTAEPPHAQQPASAPLQTMNSQWQQQSMASGSGMNSPALANNPQLAALLLQQLPQQTDPSLLLAMQNLTYYQMMMQQTKQAPQQTSSSGNPSSISNNNMGRFAGQNRGLPVGRASQGQPQQRQQQDQTSKTAGASQQVLPMAPISSNSSVSSMKNSMPPPQPTAALGSLPVAVSTAGVASPGSGSNRPAHIAPQPGLTGLESMARLGDRSETYDTHVKDKKQLKRAANRRSAQLSRKRKKQFIEELKEENDDLRRKEQILKSIPDLVVVFDSSGRLMFVSQSVSRFLRFTANELEGTSFWNRICEDSVRLLKAAFMDSLAARQAESDTAPLGSGIWELRLVDKDGSQKIVTLNGVVHFAGERPECVCSIRPGHGAATPETKTRAEKEASEVSGESSSGSSPTRPHKSLLRVKPQQSVVSNSSGWGSSSLSARKKQKLLRDTVRISDSCTSSASGDSESGSCSDELNGTSP